MTFIELPLALVSFLAYQLIRWTFARLRRFMPPGRAWRLLDAEALERKGEVLRTMVVAPRWNPAAVVGSAGPFEVEHSLELDTEAANRSAKYWSFAVYSFPEIRRVADTTALVSSGVLRLEPGRYFLAARYYLTQETIELGPVVADGKPIIPGVRAKNVNAFFESLQRYKRPLFWFLHFHVQVLLELFPSSSLARRTLLPVGSRDTAFFFGAAGRGRALELRARGNLLEDHRAWVTLYDRSSFVLRQAQLEGPELTVLIDQRCVYVVRLLRIAGAGPPAEGDLSVQLTRQ